MTVALEWTECSKSATDDAVALFTGGEIAVIAGGVLSQGAPQTAIRRVWTDSRTVRRGDLFVALTGARFDGHRFVAEALTKGAVGALVRHGFKLPGTALLFAVDEPLRAFQDVARAHRRRFDIPVVAVSGSNGKTTTKDMIGAILAERFVTLKTDGNLNNHIGVPQTLLRLAPRHEAAVIEMGISAPGELARLCEIAAPIHGVLTNIGPTHLETLGDLRAVARAKGEMLDALPAAGTAVLNADDAFFDELRALEIQQLRVLLLPAVERQAHFPGTREHLRVLDGGFVDDHLLAGPRIALHHMELVAVEIPRPVEPGLVVQAGHVYNQRIALPVAD